MAPALATLIGVDLVALIVYMPHGWALALASLIALAALHPTTGGK